MIRRTVSGSALAGFLILGLLLAICLPTGVGLETPVFAEEGDGEKKPGEGEEGKREEGEDLGEKAVPFREQINKAIDKGVIWLKNKPQIFDMDKKLKAAHWGLIHGARAYGNRKGHEYQHPAGATALALYTLLKCGVSPKEKVIKQGFNWLRERHIATKKWDAVAPQFPNGHRWVHLTKCSAYELSAMILAVTAKYDNYKKTSASRASAKKRKLKITNRADKEWLIEMVGALVERRGLPEPNKGDSDGKRGWRYNIPKLTIGGAGKGTFTTGGANAPNANQDLSSTQLAALALFNAHRFGFKIDMQIWADIISLTLDSQEKSGPDHERHDPVFKDGKYAKPMDKARGFMYIPGSPDHKEGVATGSMTACGVTNLLIAREVLEKDKKGKKLLKENQGLMKKVETGIWDGLAWLDLNWSPFANKNGGQYPIYYLYALERAMDILNKRLCGTHLWYEEGAKQLLNRQRAHMVEVKVKRNTELKETIYWMTGTTHDPKDVLDTCFALLFLKRATKGLVPGGVVTGE